MLGRRTLTLGSSRLHLSSRKIGLGDDDAGSIISSVSRIIENGRHALLLTPPGDYGLYLFLHLYDRVIAKATRTIDAKLFLDPLILKQLAVIEWRMKRKQVGITR